MLIVDEFKIKTHQYPATAMSIIEIKIDNVCYRNQLLPATLKTFSSVDWAMPIETKAFNVFNNYQLEYNVAWGRCSDGKSSLAIEVHRCYMIIKRSQQPNLLCKLENSRGPQ